ncbi:hypothetical protein QQX98_000894 [Neonectria punicea]|uniref:Uncharacterized protein n=1 Tax=Neonectria punicea TaxID=979145 RepID=A0ABR1HRW0_9HYPO
MSGTGPLTVLPNRFADEVRNNKSLSFNRYFDKDFFVNYPGFEAYHTGYKDGTFIQEVVRVKLTQSLALVNKGLVEETTDAIRDIIGDDANFHEIPAKENISALVARLSSRGFLGKTLARNRRWLEIAVDYTHNSYSAAYELRCRRLRQEVRDATTLIMPEVKSRKKAAQEALTAGKKPPKTADTIGWMHEVSWGRDVNYVHGESGWSKTALYKLMVMDSFTKESQRRHSMGSSSIHRYVDHDVELSDGSTLRKGSRMMVAADTFMDLQVYPDLEKFDLYRFYNLRSQSGQENGH